MGKRGKKHKALPRILVAAPAPIVVAVPFHAPFRELASLKPSLPPRAQRPSALVQPAAPAAKQNMSPAKPDSSTQAPDAPVLEAISEEDALAASLKGVSPLSQPVGRVTIRRKVDLSHIEAARREDIEAMARGDGFDVTFEDRYVRARAAGVSNETVSRLEKGEFPISAHLDLHGMPLEDARRAVDEFLAIQQKKGRRCVLLVTGKGKNSPGGQGVLREQLPRWLARGPSARRVLAFASARPCDGGLGALVVLMRSGSSSKNRIDVEHGGAGPLET